MQIAARQSFLTGRAGPPLPYDAEVEYLEATGTQYVDTGISPTASIRVAFNVSVNNSINNFIFGSRPAAAITAGSYAFLIQGGAYFRADWVGPGTQAENTFALASSYAVDASPATVVCNSVTKIVKSKIVNDLPFFVMSCNTNGVASAPMVGKLWFCRISDGAAIVRDFVPVRVGSGTSAVGYLYDRANPTGGPLGNGLYGNAGTGAFVIGPDK